MTARELAAHAMEHAELAQMVKRGGDRQVSSSRNHSLLHHPRKKNYRDDHVARGLLIT